MHILIIFILLTALLIITVKHFLLCREIRRISNNIRRIQDGKIETNERISVELHQKPIIYLANSINIIYEDIYRERGRHTRAIDEIHQNMAGISHDLRTPLTSIIGYVKLIQNGNNTHEQNSRYLSIVHSKALFLNQMISDLFDLTKLENNAYSFEMNRIDLGEILSEELACYYDSLTAKGQEPDILLTDEKLATIGDKNAFARIFSNLLQNMVKHGAEDIKIQSMLLNDSIEIIFSNKVHNFSIHDTERLFQRFYTADAMRTKENTGLGLALVKELSEQMDSEIFAELDNERLVFTLRCKPL